VIRLERQCRRASSYGQQLGEPIYRMCSDVQEHTSQVTSRSLRDGEIWYEVNYREMVSRDSERVRWPCRGANSGRILVPCKRSSLERCWSTRRCVVRHPRRQRSNPAIY
jgi:hypothetical protein